MGKESIKTKVLITGSSGQLGQCLKKIEGNYPNLQLCFTDSKTLDICKKENLKEFFANSQFDFVINCAAYTNVENAEKEPEKAFRVNAQGAKNLADICKEQNATLIHISTDYVFDGKKDTPYTEEDLPNPINQYGKSKLAGEKYIQETINNYFIIRTSWLYSEFGNNFLKTILRKSGNKEKLTITTSESSSPTNANDLAKFILDLVDINNDVYGIYHYSNLGEATWYDFAKEILRFSRKLEFIKLEKTDNYPTFAARPKYSVLSKEKSLECFDIEIQEWTLSLKELMKN